MIFYICLSTNFIYIVVIAHVMLGAVGEQCMVAHFKDLGLNDSFYVSLI